MEATLLVLQEKFVAFNFADHCHIVTLFIVGKIFVGQFSQLVVNYVYSEN